MTARTHHYNTRGGARRFGDLAAADVNPSNAAAARTTAAKGNMNSSSTDGNDENACPNFFADKRMAKPPERNVAMMAKLHDTQDMPTGLDDKKTNKETRRKIMLQERRMERALSQKQVKTPPPNQSVKRSLRNDFAREADEQAIDKEEQVVTSCKKEKIRHELTITPEEKKGTTVMDGPTFVARTLLVALAVYQVQLHCNDTPCILSSVVRSVEHYIEEVWWWLDNSFMISGNVLVLRLLLELRQKMNGSVSILDSEVDFSWENLLHIAFVGVFLVRALIISFTWARGSFVGERKGLRLVKCGLFFLASAACWMMILPLFIRCGSESNKYCIFVQTVTKGTITISSPRYSWLDVMVMKFYKTLSILLRTKIKGRVLKEIRGAFVNPFKFHGRLKKLFTIIRWAKFLAPLIGTCNKLRGHILDMMKKKGQHLTSKTAKKMWSDLFEAISSKSKAERAVLQLQKSFRERRELKTKRRMALMMSAERPAAQRQRIRKRLQEEHLLSKSKLIKMEIMDGERQLRRQVSNVERVNILKHRESVKRESRRLLLSPKTAFAVGWKYLAIACVVLEVSQIIFAPLLSGELKKMPLDQFLSRVLFASCDGKKMVKEFCTSSRWKQNWLMTVHVISRMLVPFVHAVCFLDVFVTFSTGELTRTGKLVPKPSFARFVFPGIGLQLIVNPTMVAFSKFVKKTMLLSVNVGPSLCFHMLLVCLPLVSYLYDVMLGLMFEFIERQNKILSRRSIFD